MREKCRVFLYAFSLCAFACSISSVGTLAGETTSETKSQESVYLAPEGVVEAEKYSSEMLERIQNAAKEQNLRLKDYVIVVAHEGERVPDEIGWMIGHFKRAGLNVKVLRKKPGSAEETAKNIEIEKERTSDEILLRLKYDASRNPDLQKLVDETPVSQGTVRSIVSRFALKLKDVFGLHNGATISMFKDEVTGVRRPTSEKTMEVLGSLPTAAAVGCLTWYSIHEQLLSNPELFPVAAGVAAAMFQVLTGYFDRAFNAFQVQGKDYFGDRKSIDTKRQWLYLCAWSHTFFTSLAVQVAANTPFGITTALVTHTAWMSLVALFAKVVPKMWIAKNQVSANGVHDTVSRQDPPKRTILLNIGFTAIYETLKYGYLLHVNPAVSTAFLSLGVLGVLYEGYQHFFGTRIKPKTVDQVEERVEKRFKKDFKYLLDFFGLRKSVQCETLLLMRPLNQNEISTPAAAGIL